MDFNFLDKLSTLINDYSLIYLDNFFLSNFLFFLAGILASLFPCVYPLYPITAGFLRNRATTNESKWKHPLIYWSGMMCVYPILGIFAVLSGGGFNKLMQSGISIIIIGFIFLYLSFVTLDWISLQFKFTDKLNQNLMRNKGTVVSFLMGGVSGIVSSACVAPVLVSLLLILSQSISASSGTNLTEFLKGMLLCFSFGLGMGLLFFITGVLQSRLPKTGVWQKFIKISFAILMIFAAMFQINKGFKVLHYTENQIALILSGLFFIFISVYLKQKISNYKESSQKNIRIVLDYFRMLFIIFGASFIISPLVVNISNNTNKLLTTHSTQTMQSMQSTQSKQSTQSRQNIINENNNFDNYEVVSGLKFYRDYDYALSLAKKENKKVFIDFYAEWCSNCKQFTEDLSKSSSVTFRKTLAENILLKIYDEDKIFDTLSNKKDFQELKIGLPFFAILDKEGKLIWKTTNYKDKIGMTKALGEKLK